MENQKNRPFPNEEENKRENENGNKNPTPDTNRTEGDKVNANNPSEGAGSDQGRSSFGTGSTTQGGSNYGQGSSQLGGSSYKQGDVANAGANYENESGRLGNTGTQAEGYNTTDAEAQKGFAAHTEAGQKATVNDDGQQKGGGATGYDPGKEQQEVNKEREHMHNERDQEQLNVENPNPSRGNESTPGTTPETPGRPSTPATGKGPEA